MAAARVQSGPVVVVVLGAVEEGLGALKDEETYVQESMAAELRYATTFANLLRSGVLKMVLDPQMPPLLPTALLEPLVFPDGSPRLRFGGLGVRLYSHLFVLTIGRGRTGEPWLTTVCIDKTMIREFRFYGLQCSGDTPLPQRHANAGHAGPLFLVCLVRYDYCGRLPRDLCPANLRKIGHFRICSGAEGAKGVVYSGDNTLRARLDLPPASPGRAEDIEILGNLNVERATVYSAKANLAIPVAPLFRKQLGHGFDFAKPFEFPHAAEALRDVSPNDARSLPVVAVRIPRAFSNLESDQWDLYGVDMDEKRSPWSRKRPKHPPNRTEPEKDIA